MSDERAQLAELKKARARWVSAMRRDIEATAPWVRFSLDQALDNIEKLDAQIAELEMLMGRGVEK